MELVIDANILFAALIKNNLTSELLFKDELDLYAPEFILSEFKKYKNEIKKKTNRTDSEFEKLLEVFQRRTELIPCEEIKPFIKQAKQICPDIGDIQYIALALKLRCAIWSNDKELKNQKIVKVYSTSEIINLFPKYKEI
ncbi:MAG: PIN domain-containing protein [Candidatus Micrarchaeia archaeon]|jgi:predicted nucleic acid-binding protein